MMPGPIQLIECPACEGRLGIFTQMSGGFAGMTVWSDGYIDLPMMLPNIKATKCPRCARLFWTNDAKEIGTMEFLEEDGSPGDEIPYIDPLGVRSAAEAVELQIWRNAAEELHVRREFQWRFNDRFRGSSEPAELPEELELNNRRVAELLTGSTGTAMLCRADISRKLGEFDRAVEILDQESSPELVDYVRVLKQAALNNDRSFFDIQERIANERLSQG